MTETVQMHFMGERYYAVLSHPDDHIQRQMRAGAPYEAEMLTDMATRLAGTNRTVIDVGANIGNHSLALAATGATVIAYEPNPDLVQPVSSALSMNPFGDRVELRASGVGARAGYGRIASFSATNIGSQTIAVDDVTGDFPVVALDSESFPGPITMIKIDVEGMEPDVIDGAKRLLAKHHPTLYVEAPTPEAYGRVARRLNPLGYAYGATFNATPTHRFTAHKLGRRGNELSRGIDQMVARLLESTEGADWLKTHPMDTNAEARAPVGDPSRSWSRLRAILRR